MKYNPKRITAFVGHYGSGKTEVALNFTTWIKTIHDNVWIADLDTVNPYYRTKDAEKLMNEKGIHVLSSEFANTNAESLSLPPQISTLFYDKTRMVVLDIGGDDDGATVLGAYFDQFKEEEYDLLYVINKRRPMTANADDAVAYLKDIERASRLKITGIVNNTNLSYETTKEVIIDSLSYAEEVSKKSQVPVVMTTVLRKFEKDLTAFCKNLFPIDLNIKYTWIPD